MTRRTTRTGTTLLLLGIGTFVSTTLDRGLSQPHPAVGPFSVLDAPRFEARVSRGRLELIGTTRSSEHESGLQRLISDQFEDVVTQMSFEPGIRLSESWESASVRLLYALAATESATATMHADGIAIRAVTAEPDTFAARLSFLREVMPADAAIEDDTITVANDEPLETLCRRAFGGIATGPIEFRISSAEIRTSSYPLLDKVIEFAYDCHHLSIAITGHSDATGSESWNRHLSLLRAQAVADYLTSGGIPAERLRVDGKGSSVPLADNDTARGRGLNRRIEFELR